MPCFVRRNGLCVIHFCAILILLVSRLWYTIFICLVSMIHNICAWYPWFTVYIYIYIYKHPLYIYNIWYIILSMIHQIYVWYPGPGNIFVWYTWYTLFMSGIYNTQYLCLIWHDTQYSLLVSICYIPFLCLVSTMQVVLVWYYWCRLFMSGMVSIINNTYLFLDPISDFYYESHTTKLFRF